MHQLSHLWLDFRGIQDAFMRRQAIDYFENSRRATYVNQQYAIRNPKGFRDYGQYTWGITASNGPGPTTRRVRGVTRRFLGCSHPLSGSRPGSPREFHVPAMKGFNHAGLRLQLSQW